MKKLLLIGVLMLAFPYGWAHAIPAPSNPTQEAPENTQPQHSGKKQICGPFANMMTVLTQQNWKMVWGGDNDTGKLVVLENSDKEWMLAVIAQGASNEKPDEVVSVMCLVNNGDNSTHE